MSQNQLSDQALQRLERLLALKNQGALSEAEFLEQKASILAAAATHAPTDRSKFSDHGATGRRGSGPTRGIIDEPGSWLKGYPLWLAIAALALLALVVGLQMRPSTTPVSTTPKTMIKARSPVPPVTPASAAPPKAEAPPAIDTAREMRAAGWDETSPDGNGCMMERRGERDNGLNFVFIYTGDGKPTYELSFTSFLRNADENVSLTAENAPDLELAVLIDGHRIPAVLQNHFGEYWEVEIPLSTATRTRIARAKMIGLQLGSEIIAREAIRPNPTSVATIERCLKPQSS